MPLFNDAQWNYITTQSWPAQAIQGLLSAARMPGDAYMGKYAGQPVEAVIPDATEFVGTVGLLGGVVPRPVGSIGMGGVPTQKSFKAHHGSPYDFEKFDFSKMGTGEGAQVRGWGGYLAENPSVSGVYRKKLSLSKLNNKLLEEIDSDASYEDILSGVQTLVRRGKLTKDEMQLLKEIDNNDWLGFDSPMQAIRALSKDNILNYDASDGLVNALGKLGTGYEVKVRANPSDFVNWEAPINQQSKVVKDALAPWYNSNSAETAGSAIKYLEQNVMQPKQLSDYLYSKGVPGTRYLDSGSRKAAEGTRNYVIFNDSILDILKKYGVVGLLGAGAGASAINSSQAQAYDGYVP